MGQLIRDVQERLSAAGYSVQWADQVERSEIWLERWSHPAMPALLLYRWRGGQAEVVEVYVPLSATPAWREKHDAALLEALDGLAS